MPIIKTLKELNEKIYISQIDLAQLNTLVKSFSPIKNVVKNISSNNINLFEADIYIVSFIKKLGARSVERGYILKRLFKRHIMVQIIFFK